MSSSLAKRIDQLLHRLQEAEQESDRGAVQKAYEDLFALCRTHDLDLATVMRQSPADRARGGFAAALKAFRFMF